MLHSLGSKFRAGALALAALGVMVAPGEVRAQSSLPCYHVYTDSYGAELVSNPYSECGEVAPATSALGGMLSGIGDSMINQQINFGGFANFVTPTGKLRHSRHDGLVIDGTNGARTAAFETDEGSVFANGSYDLPGTYFGGKVRVSALAGYDRLSQDARDGSFKNDIDAFVYGGSYLWSKGNFYSMSLIIGVSGDADGSNIGGNYSYDVSGYFTNSVYGYTFDLRSAWKFDARVNIGHYDVRTDNFLIPTTTNRIKGTSESWNAGITGTLFTIAEVSGGVMRPYVLAAYKNALDEDIDVKGDFTASFDQADNYGKVELGFDYVAGSLTYGAAAYTEFSADENTVGARLGVSVKLQ